MRGGRYTSGAGRVALTSMLTALSLVFLYAASVVPSGRLGLVAAAGIFPAAAVVSGGAGAGFLCYAASALLSLLLVPGRPSLLLYPLFFGLYPQLKHFIERLGNLLLEWLCKLVLCNAALALFWRFLGTVLLTELPAGLANFRMLLAVGNAVFILYDYGFSRLIGFYCVRIHRSVTSR